MGVSSGLREPGGSVGESLREILRVATGPVPLLARELESIAGISAAFLYGSFAARLSGVTGPAPHDIDLMVIGSPSRRLSTTRASVWSGWSGTRSTRPS